MKKILSLITASFLIAGMITAPVAHAAEDRTPSYQTTARQMEKLGRGLIAVKTTSAPNNGLSAGVYLSWRLLGDESLTNQAFDIYRNSVKIYTTGNHDATCYIDTAGDENDVYKVVKKGATRQEVDKEPEVCPSTILNYARGSLVGSGTSRPNAFTYVDIPLVRPDNIRLAFKEYDDNRVIPFVVSISEDKENWTTIYSGNSVPFSGDYMNFYVSPTKTGRYVKLDVMGNTISGWSSVAEIEVYGG